MNFKVKIALFLIVIGIIIGIVFTGHFAFSISLLAFIVYLGNMFYENTSIWLLTLFIGSFFIISIEKKFFTILLKFMRVNIFSKTIFWFSAEYVGFLTKFFKSLLELKIFIKAIIFDANSSVCFFSFDSS